MSSRFLLVAAALGLATSLASGDLVAAPQPKPPSIEIRQTPGAVLAVAELKSVDAKSNATFKVRSTPVGGPRFRNVTLPVTAQTAEYLDVGGRYLVAFSEYHQPRHQAPGDRSPRKPDKVDPYVIRASLAAEIVCRESGDALRLLDAGSAPDYANAPVEGLDFLFALVEGDDPYAARLAVAELVTRASLVDAWTGAHSKRALVWLRSDADPLARETLLSLGIAMRGRDGEQWALDAARAILASESVDRLSTLYGPALIATALKAVELEGNARDDLPLVTRWAKSSDAAIVETALATHTAWAPAESLVFVESLLRERDLAPQARLVLDHRAKALAGARR